MPSVGVLMLLLLPLMEGAPVTMDEAAEYLQTFGYIQPGRLMSVGHGGKPENPETQRRNAIKLFQGRFGIAETGQLDDATREKMAAPRCGVPDVGKLMAPGGENTIKAAFDVYSAVTPLKFREVDHDADLKISFGRGDHNCLDPFDGRGRTLAHAFYPRRGLIHFDSDEQWTIMGEHHLPESHTDFFSVAIHEFGHALGLDHSRDPAAILAASYNHPVDGNGNYKAPKLDSEALSDIQQLYGVSSRPPVTEETTASDCAATHVYATMSLPDNRIMMFPDKGRKLLEVNGRTREIIQNIDASDIFDQGPAQVTAGYYDNKQSRIMLFMGNQVWAYHFDAENLKVSLPVDDGWQTGGAFAFLPKRELVNYAHLVATYDEATNAMTVKGHINEVHPNMPMHAAGFAQFNDGSWFGFTESHVFKYDFKTYKTQDLGTINEFLNC